MGPLLEFDARYISTLFPYAYNILGSSEDAKDVVQDVLTSHLAKPKKDLVDEKNYLIRSVINHAINKKNRLRKTISEDKIWLPEPVATDDAADKNLHLKEILSYSLLVLMEKLNAKERAVFILKESFDYSHVEIANILSISEENSRKLLSRAKESLFKPAKQPAKIATIHDKNILQGLMNAIRNGDAAKLEGLMTEDISFYADGGGKVPLIAEFIKGSLQVAALQILIYQRFLQSAEIVFANVNHQPAILSYVSNKLTACQVFDINQDTGEVLQINAVLDPDKLKSLAGLYHI